MMAQAAAEALQLALVNCASEPIHRPGCIQPDGALLVVSADTTRVLQVSANVEQFLGLALEAALAGSFAELVGEGNARTIRELPVRGDLQPAVPAFFRFDAQFRFDARWRITDLAVLAHRVNGDWVIELENCNETEQQHFGRLFAATRNSLWESDNESDLGRYCQLVTDQVRHLTGFDRVMTYRFDKHWNGEVITESRNSRLPSVLGHHFPASDIPAQARRLYTRNLVRVLSDVDSEPVPLIPQTHPVTHKELDMSYAVLRSMSPVHVKYLRNMGVHAALSISLMLNGKLWGLIACHNSAPLRVPFQVRELAEFVAKSVALKLSSLEAADRSAYMKHVQETLVAITRRIGQSGDIRDVLGYLHSEILALLSASGGVIAIGGQQYPFGLVPDPDDIDGLVTWLRENRDDEIVHTECLVNEYPPAERFKSIAAGLLSVRLDPEFNEYTLWFRPERIRTISWAGNPAKSIIEDAEGIHLEPRMSFARWCEEQHGNSLPWTHIEIDSAQAISLTMIEVLSQKALISETKRAEARLKFLANHDLLTGLPNRLLLSERLESALLAAEVGRRGLAVLFVDLDHFKAVNDTHGHLIGDRYLQEVANRLKSSLRHDDILARWGGDEFVAVIEQLPGGAAVEETVQRLHARLASPVRLAGHELIPSASIGVARYPQDGVDAERLIQAADAAMYREKMKRRNNSPQLTGISIGSQLGRAFAENEFVLHYQPQLAADDSRLVGMEALIRWRHPTHGMLAPDDFFAAAQSLGMMPDIGDWVLRTVCTQINEWNAILPAGAVIALNVAPSELDPNFAERALKIIAQLDVPPQRIGFEIPEQALERRPEVVVALQQLAEAGVRLSIDGFGTGYLSLMQLRELPISCFKIDQHLIAELPGNGKDVAIIRGVVALARSLGIATVAEGVETEDQLDCLRTEGVDIVQGFFLARPLPVEKVADYLAAF
jgi:diguanylate cyclase (GGDEF)-like protein